MKQESKVLTFFLSLAGAIYFTNFLVRLIIHPAKANDPIYYETGLCIAILFLLGYFIYSWKYDLYGFLKRIILSIPFTTGLLMFIIIMGYGNRTSIIAGIWISVLLLFKTSSWKSHYAAILVPIFILFFLSKFVLSSLLDPHNPKEDNLLRVVAAMACYIPLLNFYLLYLSKLVYNSPIKWNMILSRSIKFGFAVVLSFVLYVILNDLGDRFSISLPIQLLLNSQVD